MKIKKLSIRMKLILASIILIAVSLSIVGMANISAEPTIDELVEVKEIGTYVPETLADLNADEYKLIDWVDMTELLFTYTYWKDISGDGIIQPNEDIYEQENFVENMIMGYRIYPIFSITDDSDYYVIPLSDLNRYNGVVADIHIAENNDLANLKDESTYWFDRENYVLYITKEIFDENFSEDKACPIRIETSVLVEDINASTRRINIVTLFDSKISNTHGLQNSTPNGEYEKDINNWILNNLQYRLVPASKLAYVSKDNLTVYVNATEIDTWYYDDTTGIITIKCDPFATDSVVVKFNSVQDVEFTKSVLQYFQSSNNENVGKATSMEDAFTSAGIEATFLKEVTYKNVMPKVGDRQRLTYTCYVVESKDEKGKVSKNPSEWQDYTWNAPQTIVVNAVEEYWAKAIAAGWTYSSSNGDMYRTGTLAASNDNFKYTYGDVIYNVYLGNTSSSDTGITKALAIAEEKLFSSVGGGSSALRRSWMNWETRNGMYIVGDTSTSFLGGEATSGNVMFEITCASVEARNWQQYNTMRDDAGLDRDDNLPFNASSEYNAYATIVKVGELQEDGTGYMYVCIWSPSIAYPGYGSEEGENHNQRLLGFTKVRYRYDGSGTLQFSKKDKDTGAPISGAVYDVYKKNESGQYEIYTKMPTITSEINALLLKFDTGEYKFKEKTAPIGYVLDNRTLDQLPSFTVNGNQTTTVTMEDTKQKADVVLTVYDDTTRDNAKKIPVDQVVFELWRGTTHIRTDANGRDISKITTDEDGKIKFSVYAVGEYDLKQVETKPNYYMITDTAHTDCCKSIKFTVNPTDSGRDITIPAMEHWEHRQYVEISTHVQDENLKENTMSELGGYSDTGSYVCTVGAQYKLIATTDLLLGYSNNGQPMTIDAGTSLMVSDSENGTYSQIITAESAENSKAYLSATYVQHGNVKYKLPNGGYKWVMYKSSSGYVNNGANVEINASGSKKAEAEILTMNSSAVLQKRQTAQITLFVKSYDDAGRTIGSVHIDESTYSTFIVKNDTTRIYSFNEVIPNKNPIEQWIDPLVTKTIASNSDIVSDESSECAVVIHAPDNKHINGYQIVVESNGVVNNAVYQLVNIGDIVDVATGKKISSGTILGVYTTNNNGYIKITHLDSTSALPNGTYALVLALGAPNGYIAEEGFAEEIIFETGWDAKNSNYQSLDINTVTFLRKGIALPPKPDVNSVPVAPDLKPDPSDPYDPNNPDNPEIDPDDSEDIPIVSKEWIEKNQYNKAYRVVDPDNLTGSGNDAVKDVNDVLPTTFAFYLKNDNYLDSSVSFDYKLSFYYEVDSVPNGVLLGDEYREFNGKYVRRFKTTSLSGGELLTNVIVLNDQSPGYINYESLIDNNVIAGSIYNADWLNDQLSNQDDGEYKIYIVVDMTISYTNKVSGASTQQDDPIKRYGVITFKNRQLVELD